MKSTWCASITTMKSKFHLLGLLVVLGLLSACSGKPGATPPAGDRIEVTVSILPLQYLAERLGGDRVAVHVLVGPGQSPHTYEPTPRQMADFDRSSLFVLAGVPYENALLPRLTSAFPNLRYLSVASPADEAFRHSHGADSDEPADLDPHSWLDPRETSRKAELLAAQLGAISPPDSALFVANLDLLRADLAGLDSQLTAIFTNVPRRRFYVYHPAYGWLADRYGLTQIAIEHDGKEPSPAQLAAVIAQARQDSVHTIFVQQQVAPPSVKAVASEVGARVLVVDPLARDYIENLRTLALAIATELRR